MKMNESLELETLYYIITVTVPPWVLEIEQTRKFITESHKNVI